MAATVKDGSVLALDVGTKRVGVARSLLSVGIPRPLTTLDDPAGFVPAIVELVAQEDAVAVVIGRPRGMSGQQTAQTAAAEAFGRNLEAELNVPVYWTDEALTSQQAERELAARGKPYAKGDVDALAATYILEDFLRDHKEYSNV